MSIIFETNRLRVRMYKASDEENIFKISGNEELMRYIRPAKTRQESNEFLKMILRHYTENALLGRWCVELKDTGELAGSCAVSKMENNAFIEVGYIILKKFWGQGFATEIVEGQIQYAANVLNLETLYAVTFPENTVSQKVLLKSGFEPAGTILEHGGENLLFSYKL
jgi:[ribosomal protein S5]-alanine N-acetyltransferase